MLHFEDTPARKIKRGALIMDWRERDIFKVTKVREEQGRYFFTGVFNNGEETLSGQHFANGIVQVLVSH